MDVHHVTQCGFNFQDCIVSYTYLDSYHSTGRDKSVGIIIMILGMYMYTLYIVVILLLCSHVGFEFCIQIIQYSVIRNASAHAHV